MKAISFIFLLVIVVPSIASAVSPILSPNDQYKKVGENRVQADINACRIEAEDYYRSSIRYDKKNAAKSTTGMAVQGAALGALVSVVTMQRFGSAGGAGAAIGATAAAMEGASKSGTETPEYKSYVNSCLEAKGYKVIDWK